MNPRQSDAVARCLAIAASLCLFAAAFTTPAFGVEVLVSVFDAAPDPNDPNAPTSGSVLEFDFLSGALLREFIPPGSGIAFPQPFMQDDIRFGPDGNVYAEGLTLDPNGDPTGAAIYAFDGQTGAPVGIAADITATVGPETLPMDFAFRPTDDLLFVRIFELNASSAFPEGAVVTYQSGALVDPNFIAPGNGIGGLPSFIIPVILDDILFGPGGDLYAEGLKLDPNGDPNGFAILQFDGATGATEGVVVDLAAEFGTNALLVDFAFGPAGDLFLHLFNADPNAQGTSVERIDPNGVHTQFIGPDQRIGSPLVPYLDDILFGPDGNLYVESFLFDPNDPNGNPIGAGIRGFDGATGAPLGTLVDLTDELDINHLPLDFAFRPVIPAIPLPAA